MTRNGWFAVAAVTATLAVGSSLWSAPSTASQATCGSSDVQCRLDAIESRLDGIEAALGGSGSVVGPGSAVTLAADARCLAGYDCQATATQVCAASGFPRGVPASTRNQSGTLYLVRAACVGDYGPGPAGVTMASDARCLAGYDCQSTAISVCSASGFSRGVPASIRDQGGTKYLSQATCLD